MNDRAPGFKALLMLYWKCQGDYDSPLRLFFLGTLPCYVERGISTASRRLLCRRSRLSFRSRHGCLLAINTEDERTRSSIIRAYPLLILLPCLVWSGLV